MLGDVRDLVCDPDPRRPGRAVPCQTTGAAWRSYPHTLQKTWANYVTFQAAMMKNLHMKSRPAARRLSTSAFCYFLALILKPRPRHHIFTINGTTGEADLSFYAIKPFIFGPIDRNHNHTAVLSCQSGWELVVLVLSSIQLTSQESDCVYGIIWCQKTLFTVGLLMWRQAAIQIQYSPSPSLSTRRVFKELRVKSVRGRSKKKDAREHDAAS